MRTMQSPWINVNERLPEEFEHVLVLFVHKGKPIVLMDSYLGEINGCWKFGEDKILAWMHIPSFDEILEENKDVLEEWIKEKGD